MYEIVVCLYIIQLSTLSTKGGEVCEPLCLPIKHNFPLLPHYFIFAILPKGHKFLLALANCTQHSAMNQLVAAVFLYAQSLWRYAKTQLPKHRKVRICSDKTSAIVIRSPCLLNDPCNCFHSSIWSTVLERYTEKVTLHAKIECPLKLSERFWFLFKLTACKDVY